MRNDAKQAGRTLADKRWKGATKDDREAQAKLARGATRKRMRRYSQTQRSAWAKQAADVRWSNQKKGNTKS